MTLVKPLWATNWAKTVLSSWYSWVIFKVPPSCQPLNRNQDDLPLVDGRGKSILADMKSGKRALHKSRLLASGSASRSSHDQKLALLCSSPFSPTRPTKASPIFRHVTTGVQLLCSVHNQKWRACYNWVSKPSREIQRCENSYKSAKNTPSQSSSEFETD